MSIDQAQLDQLKETLQADDYRLDVDVQGGSADVVPKPLMQAMLAPALGVEPDNIRLVYPTDAPAH